MSNLAVDIIAVVCGLFILAFMAIVRIKEESAKIDYILKKMAEEDVDLRHLYGDDKDTQ